MKILRILLILVSLSIGLAPAPAVSSLLNACTDPYTGGGQILTGNGSAIPPLPAHEADVGTVGALKITPGRTDMYVSWPDWSQAAQTESALLSYLVFYSADNGNHWNCTNTSQNYISVYSLTPEVDYLVAVVATTLFSNTYSPVMTAKTSTRRQTVQVCPAAGYYINPIGNISGYTAYSKIFSIDIVQRTPSTPATFNSESSTISGIDMGYRIEYSIDNWKTKAVVRPPLGSKTFPPYIGIDFKALSPTKIHQIRAIPDVSGDPLVESGADYTNYTTAGCKPLTLSISVKTKFDPCKLNPSGIDCPVKLVPGKKANKSAVPNSTPKKVTLICKKVASTLTVTGVKPICPSGYKKVG